MWRLVGDRWRWLGRGCPAGLGVQEQVRRAGSDAPEHPTRGIARQGAGDVATAICSAGDVGRGHRGSAENRGSHVAREVVGGDVASGGEQVQAVPEVGV